MKLHALWIKNHWINGEIPYSQCSTVKYLFNEWKFIHWMSNILVQWMKIHSLNKYFTVQHREQVISSLIQWFFIESVEYLNRADCLEIGRIFIFFHSFHIKWTGMSPKYCDYWYATLVQIISMGSLSLACLKLSTVCQISICKRFFNQTVLKHF